jgi:ubiquinone/menaquinone biosynthesis C-methylase UbiE
MNPTSYGTFDRWNAEAVTTDGDDRVRQLAALLELRGRGEDQIAMRAAYLDLLQIGPGERVLDVGCGTGVVTRDVARRVGATGHVVGLDPGPVMLAVAAELAANEGLTGQIELRVGGLQALPCQDADFDVVLAITVLSHAAGGKDAVAGEQAVAELVRVVRPGGRVGILDLDGDSCIVSHPDRDLTRRIMTAAADHGIGDAWLMRRMPGLLVEAGLQDVGSRAFAPLERNPAGFYASMVEMRAETALQAGAISEAERQRWVASLRAEQAAGRYVGGQVHLFAWGTRAMAD